MDEVMDWLAFYNHKSLHSTLGYVSPMMFDPPLVSGPAARQKVRIMGSLWSADDRGKVTDPL